MEQQQPQQQPQQRGGVLYITDPPPTLDFGIDCMHYETGSKFRGVSMVPKGIHFVYHSTGMGSRQGFFLYFEKDAIVVKSWDTRNEDISAQLLLPDAALQALIQSINYGQEDQFLGPYPLQQHSSWLNLSNFMTASTLQRAGVEFHTPIYPGDAEDIPAELLSEQNQQAVTSYFPDQARIAQFCDIKLLEKTMRSNIMSSQTLDSSAKALELSQMHLDNSSLLENVVSQYFSGSWEELLAEMQLSFMLFMLIFSFPALQQWKVLVNLVCKSERVLVSQPNFTSCFIRLFYEQLQYSPDDFFETEISSDNFLKPALSNLFEALDAQSLPNSLDAMRKRLFAFVQKKFNLYVNSEEQSDLYGVNLNQCEGTKFNLLDEDMPMVVMPDDMMQSTDTDGPSSEHRSGKSVSFAGENSGEQDRDERTVKKKWGDIDAALGLSTHATDSSSCDVDNSGSLQEDPGSRMEEVDESETPSLRTSQNINPNSDAPSGSSSEGRDFRSSLELQSSMFSWRYPLLFDAMTCHNTAATQISSGGDAHSCGHEDLTMTAMRVIEVTRQDDGDDSVGRVDPLRAEAVRFVQDEISLW